MGRLTVPNVDPNALASGEANISRLDAITSVTLNTGVLRLGFWTAVKSEPVNSLRTLTGSTAAGATPTLIRYALYLVDAAGDLALVASTANDTALLASGSTPYSKATSATYSKIAGQRYAGGLLVVTGATAPTVAGMSVTTAATEAALAPRVCAALTGQTDLPETIAAGSLTGSNQYPYFATAP